MEKNKITILTVICIILVSALVINSSSNRKKLSANALLKCKTDPTYKIAKNLRNRLRAAIKDNIKTGSAVKDAGCTLDYLKFWLESQFYDHPITGKQMSWANYGKFGWHIDHKLTLSLFNLEDREQLLTACDYYNLRPLWCHENLSKGDTVFLLEGRPSSAALNYDESFDYEGEIINA